MYKESKFNLSFENDGNFFLYNSHTGCFVILDEEHRKSIDSVRNKELNLIPESHLEKLQEAGFIVKSITNEFKMYTYLSNKTKYSNSSLGLTIATTLQCNFRCPYCYEEHLDSYFDEEKESKLLEFIKDNCSEKNFLSITWYGGEPLLKIDMINRVTGKIIDFCNENEILYQFDMVSNGYLLTKKVAERLVNQNQIRSVQITLDGGPRTHNLTRILRNGQGTFTQIINNIKDICEIIHVNIRVNVTKENVEDVHEIFPILLNHGLNKKVNIYFAPVTSHEGTCQSISDSCLRTEEFSKWEIELINYADSLGFDIGNYYPSNLGGNVCTAINDSAFVIDSEGSLYKCWNEVGKDHLKVGTLEEGITNKDKYIDWIEWQFPEKCNDCSVFPLCKGRCPDMSRDGKTFDCMSIKYNIIDRLLRYYKLNDSNIKQSYSTKIDYKLFNR